jgi:hypothetical protein
MFPITVTITNTAQLNAVMAALATGGEAVQEVAAAPAPKQKTTPAKTATPAPTQPTAEVEAAAAPEKKPEPSATTQAADAPAAADTPAIAVADVNASIIALAKAKGRDAAVAVLQQFGVAKVPELKADQYADVLAAVKKAMA